MALIFIQRVLHARENGRRAAGADKPGALASAREHWFNDRTDVVRKKSPEIIPATFQLGGSRRIGRTEVFEQPHAAERKAMRELGMLALADDEFRTAATHVENQQPLSHE